MKVLFLSFFMSLLINFHYAQQNTTNIIVEAPTNSNVSYEVDLSNIQIGKPFSVTYTMPDTIMQIIDIGTNIQAQGDTDITVTNLTPKTLDLSVTSYALAEYPMPSLLITALDYQSNTNQFYTPGFLIPITNDIITDTNLTLADIEPIYFIWDHLWTIAIAIFLLIILGICFIPQLIKPKEKKEEIIIVDPFEEIKHKLDKLKNQSTQLTEESYKEFFVELSEAVREFISYTLIPLALELPTREVIAAMKELKIEPELHEIIIMILRNTDRAKYAKQIFSQERISEVIEDSFKMVRFVKRKKDKEKADELRKS